MMGHFEFYLSLPSHLKSPLLLQWPYNRGTTKYYTYRVREFRVMVFNATFNDISVISCRSVLLVEETGVPGKNHDLPQVTDKL
jgi:hypothetical protein